MKELLCEPVELTELELDAVAGGNPFSINVVASDFSDVHATIAATLENLSTNMQLNTVNNSINVSGP